MTEPATPKRTARPPMKRSRTADASISPPERRPTAQQHAHSHSRKLPIHLGELVHHHHHRHSHHDKDDKDRPRRGSGSAGSRRNLVSVAARSRPVSAVMSDLGRIASRLPATGGSDINTTTTTTNTTINANSLSNARLGILVPGSNSGNGNGNRSGSASGSAGTAFSRVGVEALLLAAVARNNTPAKLPIKIPPGRISPEMVQAERERGAVRDEELRTALDSLSELAQKGMRKLDNTYYSILEKAALLRSTVIQLQELCTASTSLHERFQSDTAEVQEEIESSIESFGGFVEQKSRIDELEGRIRAGRHRADDLSERLERARREVEALDKEEMHRQSTATKRLRFVWAAITVLCVAVLVLALLKKSYYRSSGIDRVEVAALEKEGSSGLWKNETAALPDFIVKELADASAAALQSVSSLHNHKSHPTLTRDLRLDKFDEL